ncbi:MAG TPA: putative glycolipid-binding domain-containing protein [Pyrinomonadaceae bacterium]|nr:putative glycolipid-binding domain-containing protein [Pyrinomonadaceae bacterium]
MDHERSIIWRRLDKPGHESAQLFRLDSVWHLTGTAVFLHNQQACRLNYLVQSNSRWETMSGKVAGWVGDQIIEVEISVDSDRRWLLNGEESSEVTGCIDIDLNFSPSANLLPIRRLDLAVGQVANVRAAWLRFPSFRLEPLEQTYRRVESSTYRYESAGGSFVADLQIGDGGFVTHYPNLWRVENDSLTPTSKSL